MMKNRIWAPWRKAYIRAEPRKKKGCLFCRLRHARDDKKHFILNRSSLSFAVLNKYPYNNGHVMILPNRHVSTMASLSDAERLDWLKLTDEVVKAIRRILKPNGFNMGINLGRVAGAGIPGHLHLHVVPRWDGDCNFMTVVGEVKVISESLKSVYQVLRGGLRQSSDRKRCR